jgi:hypothetical protein
MARIQAAMSAQERVRQTGGDPAAIMALAMPRSERVEGVTLFANPPSTYAALRLVRDFFPQATTEEEENSLDRLIAMAYAFAEPIKAFLTARKGADAYLTAALEWAGEHFTGPDLSYRIGRVAGWCAGVLQVLEDLSFQVRAATPPTLAQAPGPTTKPAPPPAPMPVSSPP